MDDTDLRGLSAEDAKAYALEFLSALKGLERELATIGTEAGVWAKRTELAAAKGAAELEAAARARLGELDSRRSALELERAELEAKVRRLKERLPMAGAAERSVDPDLLLAELRTAAGLDPDDRQAGDAPEGAALDRNIAALGADDALAALKKKMQEGS